MDKPLLQLLWWFGILVILPRVNSEDLIQKFQQHDYQINFERAEAVSYNKDYVTLLQVKTFKYNRTCTAFNTTLIMKVDVGRKIEIVVQAYRFASNEYREFPLRFEINYCDALESNLIGVGNYGKCGNFTGCPLQKNINYHVCNFTPDPSRFPPLIPSGKYMVELQASYLSTDIFVERGYIEIMRPFTGK